MTTSPSTHPGRDSFPSVHTPDVTPDVRTRESDMEMESDVAKDVDGDVRRDGDVEMRGARGPGRVQFGAVRAQVRSC